MLKLPWVYLIIWECLNSSLKFLSSIYLIHYLRYVSSTDYLDSILLCTSELLWYQFYRNKDWDPCIKITCEICYVSIFIPSLDPWVAQSTWYQYADHRSSPFLSFARQMNGFQIISRLYFSPDFLTDECWRKRRAVVIVVVIFASRGIQIQSGLRQKDDAFQQISFKRGITVPALRKCPKPYVMKDMHTDWYFLNCSISRKMQEEKKYWQYWVCGKTQILKPSHQACVQLWPCVSEKTQMFFQQSTNVQRCDVLLQCIISSSALWEGTEIRTSPTGFSCAPN